MLHWREAWASVPLDRKDKTSIRGIAPAKHWKKVMTISMTQLKEIRQEFSNLKPAFVTMEGNRTISVKEAVFALAPTLERMKKRGFDIQEIVERLHEKGIEVKAPTLNKYLSEFRRRKEKKKDEPPSPPSTEKRLEYIKRSVSENTHHQNSFIIPATPVDEL